MARGQDGGRDETRRQLVGHLQRLQGEGVWALPAPRTSESPTEAHGQPAQPSLLQEPASESELDRYRDADETLAQIESEALVCTACPLSEGRKHVVFGVGAHKARLMFIGEGPGRDEDLQGEPFVGRAGKLLNDIIDAMKLRREDVYIANAVKCRPPNNRNPEADELAACRHFLLRQVSVIKPDVIILLGLVAVQTILQVKAPLGRLRGRFHDWNGIPVMCTYHPAYLLRNPGEKGKVWADIKLVMAFLDQQAVVKV